jgi:hypothetical protein
LYLCFGTRGGVEVDEHGEGLGLALPESVSCSDFLSVVMIVSRPLTTALLTTAVSVACFFFFSFFCFFTCFFFFTSLSVSHTCLFEPEAK